MLMNSLLGVVAVVTGAASSLDLTNAVVVRPDAFSGPERKAVEMLLEEVEERTGLRWREGNPLHDNVVISIGSVAASAPDAPTPPDSAESYAIRTKDDQVQITGRDARGVLFGIGRLLRELRMEHGKVSLDAPLDVSTAPAYPLRGHQLGYRPKTNSYDAWTVEIWEQYIRDLAVFGTNAIELLPPRTDDADDSPHYPLPPIEMLKRMSQICADYGLDVWMWYPALDKNYDDPAMVQAALEEWHGVLSQVPRLDALFVPGGDPGHTEPRTMMALLEKQTENLHRSHPNAKMWMSPQGFTKEWMDTFIDYMKTEQPKWLSGVVFGPQNRLRLEELRTLLPSQYPIRHYPDITHTMQCQFPVPDWDHAYAITEQRECINPRPTQYAHIHRLFAPPTIGFISYSEGCNDDVNKILWSAWGWEPEAKPVDILREYARYFIGPHLEDEIAQGILALEQNWVGLLATNQGVQTTFAQFQQMERDATPQDKLNWRFQQLLYRAYYDAYTQQRKVYEMQLEQDALAALRKAPKLGAASVVKHARDTLMRAVDAPVAQDLRARVFELGEALYQSIRMQLSVPKYQAIHTDRGANLDLIDLPLNDRDWMLARFDAIGTMETEAQRLRAIDEMLNWTNPGPGGFYDDLGNLTQQPHLVRSAEWYPDPEFKSEPINGREYFPGFKRSWCDWAETRYESPLQLRYEGLVPDAQYAVRVVYGGDADERKMRMEAGDGEVVHDFIAKPWPPAPLEFDLPAAAHADGVLELTFRQEPGRGGNGRGCQVTEVWVLKK